MEEISILMSIYNETLNEIERAINSILNQTYKNFIFVIVLDNPEREDVKEYLIDKSKTDFRIRLIFNQQNIGLALSLNKARNEINSKYLCRMDADDVSMPNRLQVQLEYIKNEEADLVFSQFNYIDSKGIIIGTENEYYEADKINNLLNVINIIHHPTVFMKTDAFDKVGGYRNFPCAQDYDLWLRLSESKCKFVMVREKLLNYTIRENSVGNSKAFMQIATLNYIKRLRNMRLKKGYDNYSIDNLKKYYNENKVSNNELQSQKVRYDLNKAQKCSKEKRYLTRILIKIKIFMKYNMYREHYINKIRDKIFFLYIKKGYKNG